jgi:hypothetical protein
VATTPETDEARCKHQAVYTHVRDYAQQLKWCTMQVNANFIAHQMQRKHVSLTGIGCGVLTGKEVL